MRKLRLLVVRRHPDLVGHEHGEVGAGLGELADGGREIDDASGLRRGHGRVGEVELRLVALGVGLREARLGAAALRLERIDLALGDREGRLRILERGLVLAKRRSRLLGHLHGSRLALGQVLVARRLLLREGQRRLRLLHLRLARADLRLLHRDLGVDVLDVGGCGGDLRFRLLERDAVIAVVDARDHVACDDVLVVGDRHRGDVARHLRRDRELARLDEGVVGRLEVPA